MDSNPPSNPTAPPSVFRQTNQSSASQTNQQGMNPLLELSGYVDWDPLDEHQGDLSDHSAIFGAGLDSFGFDPVLFDDFMNADSFQAMPAGVPLQYYAGPGYAAPGPLNASPVNTTVHMHAIHGNVNVTLTPKIMPAVATGTSFSQSVTQPASDMVNPYVASYGVLDLDPNGPDVNFAPDTAKKAAKTKVPGRMTINEDMLNTNLCFTSYDTSLAIVARRVPLDLPNDDVHVCRAQAATHVRQIILAFGAGLPTTVTPHVQDKVENRNISLVEANRVWNEWQNEAYNAIVERLSDKHRTNERRYTERAAWTLMHCIINMHLLGCVNIHDSKASVVANLNLTCGERIAAVIKVMHQSAIIRWDVLRGLNLVEFVVNPEGAQVQKEQNFVGNKLYRARKARTTKRKTKVEEDEDLDEDEYTISIAAPKRSSKKRGTNDNSEYSGSRKKFKKS